LTLQKADPTSLAIQGEINTAVLAKVATEAIYTITFRGRGELTAISAKGAEELYAQCVTRGLCPEIQLLQCNDKVIEEQWICDGVWRATWTGTGETYTVDARGSEPYPGGAQQDPMSVVNRKAMGKALRNAHLKVVPSVIRESYLRQLRETTGRDVIHSEEYVPTNTPPKQSQAKANPSPSADTLLTEALQAKAHPANAAPHQIVYEHAKTLGLEPARDIKTIYLALGEVSVPNFLESSTPEEACALLTKYVGTHRTNNGGNDGNKD